ncbi:MAG: cytochrome c biogenesis protein [Leadbetterella sp.]|nr:cytochrome c biogenesis protein [Leadbetterella sp.]
MKKYWWKFLGAALLIYSVVFGFLGETPRREILNETIRMVYFHVPMWFAMMALMVNSLVYSVRYLRSGKNRDDIYASQFAAVSIVFGILGFLTGMLWGNYTWGDWLPKDPKLIAVEVGLLIYSAYFILRGSFDDEQRRARLSGIYNIFAFASFMPLVWILPRLTDSLHPGNGGNPAFGSDMDLKMRMVFWPAVLGWILIGTWITTLRIRLKLINETING